MIEGEITVEGSDAKYLKWVDENEELVAIGDSFQFTMPAKDTVITPCIVDKTVVTVETDPEGASGVSGNEIGCYLPGTMLNLGVDEYKILGDGDSRYYFENWTINGNVIGESTNLKYTVTDDDVTIMANYVKQHKFTTSSSDTSMGTTNSISVWVEEGSQTPTRTASPKYDYILFDCWKIDDVVVVDEGGIPYGNTISITMPNGPLHLIAYFSMMTHEVMANTEPEGKGVTLSLIHI